MSRRFLDGEGIIPPLLLLFGLLGAAGSLLFALGTLGLALIGILH